MAIVPDRKLAWQREIEKLQTQSPVTTDMQNEIQRLLMLVDDEETKRQRQKVENVRRKHNYLPLIVELLRMLAQKGQLLPMYEKAKQRAMVKATSNKSKSWIVSCLNEYGGGGAGDEWNTPHDAEKMTHSI